MAIDDKRQEFFRSRTEKGPGGHLFWIGASVPRGYGKMTIDGENVYAHRVAWCVDKGLNLRDIEGHEILVMCEYLDCVAIGHLASRPKARGKYQRP
jgi:hypothetical protein